MDLFKKLEKQNKNFRENLNPFRKTGCCGGIQSKKVNKYNDIYTAISEDDPTNF